MKLFMMLQRFSGPDGGWVIKMVSMTEEEVQVIVRGEGLRPDRTGLPPGDETRQFRRRSRGDGAKWYYVRFVIDRDTEHGEFI